MLLLYSDVRKNEKEIFQNSKKMDELIEEMKKWGLSPLSDKEFEAVKNRVIFRDNPSEEEKRIRIERDRLGEVITESAYEYITGLLDENEVQIKNDFAPIEAAISLLTTEGFNEDQLQRYEEILHLPLRKIVKKYEIIESLGDEEAQVYKAIRRSDGKLLIVKVVPKEGVREMEIMKQLDCHPYVSCLLGYEYDIPTYSYILEISFIEGETIEDFFGRSFKEKSRKTGGEGFYESVLAALKDVSCTLSKIHSKGIVHGDLHQHNIMIDKNNNPVIIDFGTACFEEECPSRLSKANDIYRLGETFAFVTIGRFIGGQKLTIPNKKLETLINRMLDRSITAKEICETI